MRRLTTCTHSKSPIIRENLILRSKTEVTKYMESPSRNNKSILASYEIKLEDDNPQLPTRVLMGSNSSIFKPSVDISIPQKTNIRNLNDFLKRQTLIFRHKEKVLMQADKKVNQSDLLNDLQNKIVRMLKLQTASQFLLEPNR